MSRLRIALIASLLLLVASNVLWAVRLVREEAPELPRSYGCTEFEQYVELRQELVQPLAAAINSSLKPGATKESILTAATDASIRSESLDCVREADSDIGVRAIGLRFDGDKLIAVSTEY